MNCPRCSSTSTKRNGRSGDRQRYKCKDCGKGWIENPRPRGGDRRQQSDAVTDLANALGISRNAARVRLSRARTGKTGNEARNREMPREQAIAKLREIQTADDEVEAHMDADIVLIDLLKSLGYEDVVQEYQKIDKWYA